MPYFGVDAVGGAERANANLIKILDYAENLVFYPSSPKSVRRKYAFEGIQCIQDRTEEISKVASGFKPDLVIVTHELIKDAMDLAYPYLIYLHDPRAHCLNASTNHCNFNCNNCAFFLTSEIYRFAYKKAMAVAYCSNYLKSIAENQYPEAIYLETPWFPLQNLIMSSFSAPANIIGTTAGVPHKGQNLLIKLAESMKNTRFILVGPTNSEKFPPNIKYLGYIPDKNMFRDFYSKIGTYLGLAAYGEAYGMTIVESHAYGIPTLLPRSDGLSESGGCNSNFVEKENIENVNHWRSRLFELMKDVALRERSIFHGHANYQIKYQYSKKIYASLKQLLRKL